MARRTSTNIQPAVMTITSSTASVGAGATGSFFMDLSQVASLLNRRFYRQGLNWAVAGIKMITATGVSGLVTIKQVPNTWVTSNAWEKAFRAWNKQQMDAIEEAGAQSAVARFRDFKVHADSDHAIAGFASNLLPLDGQLPVAQPYAVGEWESSLIVLPNADIDAASGARTEPRENILHMCGANEVAGGAFVSRGILEGYADSRAYPQSPDPVSPQIDSGNNWLRAMFDVGNDNEDITDNATDRNDNLPYPQVNYPGGETQAPSMQIHDIVGISGTSIGNMSRAKGGNFPCGLIRIDFQNTGDLAGNLALQIDLVPGNHRGYLAEPMTEM
ncbi:MAG: hypothetical protein HN544_04660 [Euryarchaeota archaeon]|jgi:hypothetical protein|nr:hypothetical protein [Euryarchaeota archaeon]